MRYKTYYTVIYQRKLGARFVGGYGHRTIGCYTDIRDAVQEIIKYYRKNINYDGEFLIGSSETKPKDWIHPTKYNET
jgi:hypothetical protein